jgi:hypothetical protein
LNEKFLNKSLFKFAKIYVCFAPLRLCLGGGTLPRRRQFRVVCSAMHITGKLKNSSLFLSLVNKNKILKTIILKLRVKQNSIFFSFLEKSEKEKKF